MRILFVSHRFPSTPDSGAKVRAYHMIKHLGAAHEVVVASLVRSREEAGDAARIAPHCSRYIVERVTPAAAMARMLIRLPTPVPSSMGYFYSPRLRARIAEELDRDAFDLIIVHSSSVAQYVEDVSDVPKMLDFVDMDSQKWLAYSRTRAFPMSFGYHLEGTKLERAECLLAGKFDLSTCATPAELETLRSYGSARRTGYFPNGVRLDYFRPGEAEPDPNLISFVGHMNYFPNAAAMTYFSREILPLIRQEIPAAKLVIVGSRPPRRVRDLARIKGVSVTGTVTDVRPYVQNSAVSVVPLEIARGTQNKILEALAMGVPVVASQVAATGIDAEPGEHFLTATTPQEFADAVVSLLADRRRARELGEAGRERVVSHHNWERSMERMESLIDDCLGSRESRAEGELRHEVS